jgi:dienelactone hydrolase
MKTAALVIMVAVAMTAFAVETEEIRYEQGGMAFVGYLAIDPAVEGPRPVVFVVHEWWGLTDHPRQAAEKLARQGFVGFAVDMYGEGKHTDNPQQAGEWAGQVRQHPQGAMATLQAALDAIKDRETVDADRVAVIGYCFGGTVALEAARMGWEPLDAAVSFHGTLASGVPPAERFLKAAVQVHHGAADTHVPEEDLEALQKELAEADIDWQLNIYGNAKHSFTNPEADKLMMEGVGFNKAAAERSWAAMTVFFDDVLR